ncbi:hypothetical protein J437_LFUL006619 [Ladona fulva]|uniref:Maestro/Maestro-like HEAT-repeats domain-containing protein n=1 Tax=Ladona fulva TaxID=123851 RepID=A0A8K0P6D8_LADFU|nr:hypothetical protein J437_LFUL006619 [Ladona fulva]
MKKDGSVHQKGILVLRLKHKREENNASLRSASISLLGNIAKYGIGRAAAMDEADDLEINSSNWNAFEEQVKSNLVCLLLRLADSEEDVVKSCKFALREMSHIMEIHWHAKKVASMIQLHLIDVATLQYERFMTDLVKLMLL